jgi:hypothetical protein
MGCAGNKKQYLSFLSKIFYLIIEYSSAYFWTGSAALEELRSHFSKNNTFSLFLRVPGIFKVEREQLTLD